MKITQLQKATQPIYLNVHAFIADEESIPYGIRIVLSMTDNDGDETVPVLMHWRSYTISNADLHRLFRIPINKSLFHDTLRLSTEGKKLTFKMLWHMLNRLQGMTVPVYVESENKVKNISLTNGIRFLHGDIKAIQRGFNATVNALSDLLDNL